MNKKVSPIKKKLSLATIVFMLFLVFFSPVTSAALNSQAFPNNSPEEENVFIPEAEIQNSRGNITIQAIICREGSPCDLGTASTSGNDYDLADQGEYYWFTVTVPTGTGTVDFEVEPEFTIKHSGNEKPGSLTINIGGE